MMIIIDSAIVIVHYMWSDSWGDNIIAIYRLLIYPRVS